MKKLIIIVLLISAVETVFAQTETTEKKKVEFLAGIRLQPYDCAAGMNHGLGFYLPNNRFRICLRNDFTFNYGEQTILDDNGNVIVLEKNGIYNYHTYNYLDFDYKISTKRNLFVGIAPGWVFAGGNQNYKFDESAGYYVLSLSAKL
jgi:hypothetical protein